MNLFKKKTNWSNFFGLDDSQEEDFSLESPMVDEEESFEQEIPQYSNEPSYENEMVEEKQENFSDLSSSSSLCFSSINVGNSSFF